MERRRAGLLVDPSLGATDLAGIEGVAPLLHDPREDLAGRALLGRSGCLIVEAKGVPDEVVLGESDRALRRLFGDRGPESVGGLGIEVEESREATAVVLIWLASDASRRARETGIIAAIDEEDGFSDWESFVESVEGSRVELPESPSLSDPRLVTGVLDNWLMFAIETNPYMG